MADPTDLRHTTLEDVVALGVGTLFVAVGMEIYRRLGLAAGGTAGLGLLLHYAVGWSLALSVAVVNLPFYVFSWIRMGWRFTLKTVVSVGLLTGELWLVPRVIVFERIDLGFGTVFGGLLIGSGLLILIRHRSSLGGVGIVALWLQETRGWRAGRVQMVVDTAILCGAVTIVAPLLLGFSIVGGLVLNFVLATNHRSGRYTGY